MGLTQMASKINEIVICEECSGTGITSEIVSYDEYEDRVCTSCGGAGMLVRTEEIKYNKLP